MIKNIQVIILIILLALFNNNIIVSGNQLFFISSNNSLANPEPITRLYINEGKYLKTTFETFTENQGQLENKRVRFYSGSGGIWFTDDGVWFEIQDEVEANDLVLNCNGQDSKIIKESLKIKESSNNNEFERIIINQEFIGRNHVKPVGRKRLGWNSNFFYGNKSGKWCTNVPNFAEVWYENIYNGIDLKYYTNEKGLKYDFIVHPGANIGDIRVKYEGANKIYIDNCGNLNIETKLRDIIDGDLFIYQDVNKMRFQIEGKFIKFDNLEYGFEILSDYYLDEVIVIDPFINLSTSTYLGGMMSEKGESIAVDQFGNTFVTGITYSSDFPTTPGANDTSINGLLGDVFILKLNSNCSNLHYSTFIGGNEMERGWGIDIDHYGNAYVTGETNSSDFPTTPNAYDKIFNNINLTYWDVFVLKLDNSGSKLIFSTYLGGASNDWGYGITIDVFHNVYITGRTSSSNFPVTPGVYGPIYNGSNDIFITRLNHSGSTLDYSTFIGGSNSDGGYDIILDDNNNAFITGYSYSWDFPTTQGANDTSFNGGNDVIVVKLNSSGTGLFFSTFFGGNDGDFGSTITIDSIGNSYVTGSTRSPNLPTTPNALDRTFNGTLDSFFFKLNQTGSSLIYSTYIGGINTDGGTGLSLDFFGNIFLIGQTSSTDFPITKDAFDKSCEGSDVYLIKLASNCTRIIYSTFIGGQGNDYGSDIVMDIGSNCYITGMTDSNDFQTTEDAYARSLGGETDTFVVKFFNVPIFNISSVSVFINNTPTNLIYSRLSHYTFRIKILDTHEILNLSTVYLTLDPQGSNLQLIWDRLTGQFSELFDPNNYILISPTSKANFQIFNWIIDFDIIFNWTYPGEDLNDVQTYATAKALPPTWLNVTNLYQVENDLVFNGTLSVFGEDYNELQENDLVRGGEELYWSGLEVVYENTTDVYPPDNEYDVTIWHENEQLGLDSPTQGGNFTIQTITTFDTNIEGYNHIINISRIPVQCDKTNETFTILIDGDNVTFSNPFPDGKTWRNYPELSVGITINDSGGGEVDGSSIMYTKSIDNGTNWEPWAPVDSVTSNKSISITDLEKFEEGEKNLIKWSAKDSLGNGPAESEPYRILVDTTPVFFFKPIPLSTQESSTGEVEVGITISDNSSGVNASTIKYSTSTNGGEYWSSWKTVDGSINDKIVDVKLNLTLPNGTDNRIRWRAYDVAGNGPTYSDEYIINVNISTTPVIPEINLLSPFNNQRIPTTSVEFSWEVIKNYYPNIEFDFKLDTQNPPTKILKQGHSEITLKINDLENGKTYYWTVIPRLNNINGTCLSGIWSFTVDIPLPRAILKTPENNSIITSTLPTLVWSLGYEGTESVTYDIYFGTNKDPPLEFEKSTTNYFAIDTALQDNTTYYWKIVPWVGKYEGFSSEIWSFTVELKGNEIPEFGIELYLNPNPLEIKPGEVKFVSAIVTNLGELTDNFTVVIGDINTTKLTAENYRQDTLEIEPGKNKEFLIMVSINDNTKPGFDNITITAKSKLAEKYNMDIQDSQMLSIKILEKEDQTGKERGQPVNIFYFSILLFIIILIIISIIIVILVRKKSSKKDSGVVETQEIIPETPPESVSKPEPETTVEPLPGTTQQHDETMEE